MSARSIEPEEEEAFVQQYRQGASLKQLAGLYGCSTHACRMTLRRLGVETRGMGRPRWRSFTQEQVEEMANLWIEGESQTAIAKKFDTTQVIVSRLLRDAGHTVERRPKHLSREQHPSFKGGRVMLGPYWAVRVYPDDPMYCMANSGGYVLEHRLVMARHLGRPLTPSETVHHKDTDHTNNAIENLQLRQGKHGNGGHFRCLDCGSSNIEAGDL